MSKLIVIGDSWTYGSEIRHPELPASVKDWDVQNDEYRLPKIWPTKLAKLMGFDECINLSYPAASNDRSVRVIMQWLGQEYFTPNKSTEDIFVIIGLTSPERRDFYFRKNDENEWITLWPNNGHFHYRPEVQELSELYVAYYWNPEEYINRYINQIMYIQSLFTMKKIKYLIFQAFYENKNVGIRNWEDDPYIRNYQSNNDTHMWNLIDPVRFVNKNEKIHSFHNYISSVDRKHNTNLAFLNIHPSEIGHTWWAEFLFDYIKKNELFESVGYKSKIIHNNKHRI